MDLCNNTGTEEETLALQKKRARRVSFAEITSVHVFDKDEDSETAASRESSPDSRTPNHPFTAPGFAKVSPGSGDSNYDCSNEDDQDDDEEDDEEDDRRSFLRPIHSPSPGRSTLGSNSNTSNDDENFFGPVSSSFIRPRKLSDSKELDENHDITMDSTAFSMHFHSLARSDSGGCASKTPTMKRLTFGEKTPTQNTIAGSSMELIHDDIHECGSSAQMNSVNYSGSPNDMSIVEEKSRKYDFENLSPELDALLAEGIDDFEEGSSHDGRNVITMSTINSSNNIHENNIRSDGGGISIVTTPDNISAEKQSASQSVTNILKKESSPSIAQTFNFSSSSVIRDLKVQTPTHTIKEKSLYQGHQVVKAALEKSRLKLINAVNSTTLSPGFNTVAKLNMQQDHEKSSSLERLVEKQSEKVEKYSISNPYHTVMSTPLSADGKRNVFLDLAVVSNSNSNKSIHSHGKSTLSFDKESLKTVKSELPNESNIEHSPGYFSRKSTNTFLENNNKMNILPDFTLLRQKHHDSLNKRDVETFSDGRFRNLDNVSRLGGGKDLRAELFQHKFSMDTLYSERPTKLMRAAVSSLQYTPTEKKDNIITFGKIHNPSENTNLKSFLPRIPNKLTDLIPGTDPSRISKGNVKQSSPFGLESLHFRSKIIINQKMQVSPSLKEEVEKRQGIDNYFKGLNILNKNKDMGNSVGMMRNVASTEAEITRNESRDLSRNMVNNEGKQTFQHCSDQLFEKLSEYEKQLISPSVGKLKIHEIIHVEDAFRQHQMIKTKETPCFGVSSQIFNDPIIHAKYKRIWQSRLLLDKVVSKLAMGQLLSIKRERLLNRIQFLTSKVAECFDLKNTLLNHSTSLGIDGPQVMGKPNHSYVVDENQKDYIDKVQTLRGEVDSSSRKITDCLKLFPANYTAMGKTSDIVGSLRDYIEKLDHYCVVRQAIQLWCIDNVENKSGHYNIRLNYCNLVFKSILMPVVLVSTTIIVSNKLNNAEISKRFSGMEACTAFIFVFGNTMQKRISMPNIPCETQITSSLLSNLLDVIEEVQHARLELKNLIRARFFCPSDKQLFLELLFINVVGGSKAVLTLDMTTLNRGVYPSHLIPLSTDVLPPASVTDLRCVRKIEPTMVVGLEPGYFRVLRMCRHISHTLSRSTVTTSMYV